MPKTAGGDTISIPNEQPEKSSDSNPVQPEDVQQAFPPEGKVLVMTAEDAIAYMEAHPGSNVQKPVIEVSEYRATVQDSGDYPNGKFSERSRVSFVKGAERVINADAGRIDRGWVRAMVGARIRRRRGELELSQEHLGNLVRMSRESISQYEVGRSRLDTGDLPRLCVALEVPITYLFLDVLPESSLDPVKGALDGFYARLDERDRRVLMEMAQSLSTHKRGGGEARKKEEVPVAKTGEDVL